jgi:hypothetical protein
LGGCASSAGRRRSACRWFRFRGAKRSTWCRHSAISERARHFHAWLNRTEWLESDEPEFDESERNEPKYLESDESELDKSERNEPEHFESDEPELDESECNEPKRNESQYDESADQPEHAASNFAAALSGRFFFLSGLRRARFFLKSVDATCSG